MANKRLTASRLIALMETTHIGTPATVEKLGAGMAPCFHFQFSSETVSKQILLKLSSVMEKPTNIIIQIISLMFINHYCTVF
jgi:hypothetical protein